MLGGYPLDRHTLLENESGHVGIAGADKAAICRAPYSAESHRLSDRPGQSPQRLVHRVLAHSAIGFGQRLMASGFGRQTVDVPKFGVFERVGSGFAKVPATMVLSPFPGSARSMALVLLQIPFQQDENRILPDLHLVVA